MLRCLGGNSPYLSELALRESDTVHLLVTDGPDAAFAHGLSSLSHVSPAIKRPDVAAGLREGEARRRAGRSDSGYRGNLAIGNCDGRACPKLAEATLRLALRHLLRAAHDAGEIRLQDANRPELNCGFVALAMGKLGAGGAELFVRYRPDSFI